VGVDPAYEAQIEAWRRARAARLLRPDGHLATVGKFVLQPGESRIGADPSLEVALPEGKAPALVATAVLAGDAVTVTAAPGVAATVRGLPLTTATLGQGDVVALGTLRMDLLRRDGEVILRVKDEDSDLRRTFPGIPYFPLSEAWRVEARYEPLAEPRTFELDFGDGASEVYSSPAMVAFDRDGKTHRLYAMTERDRLFFLFKDQTNRDATYGGGRFLYAAPPVDGRVVLDFNQAFNPPCAFNPWTTCPLPPEENRLAIRVEAGERRP